jgi:peptidoglycan/LPS O-acetylase OafA/YrhL
MIRLEQLTFLRFIAAIFIVVFHFGHLYPFNYETFSYFFKKSYIGVSFFYILSGYVIYIAYSHRPNITIGSFYFKRFKRIYPLYFLALVLLLIYYIILPKTIQITDLFLQTLAVQSWVPSRTLHFNTPGWSISVEFFFYATFPLLANYVYPKLSLKQKTIVIGAIWLFTQFLIAFYEKFEIFNSNKTINHAQFLNLPIMHLNQFLVGNLAAMYYLKYLKDRKVNYDLVIIAITALLVVNMYFFVNPSSNNGIMAIIFVPLILFCSMNTGVITKLSVWKPFVFLGEISYGVYILQSPVFLLTKKSCTWLHWPISVNVLFYMSLLLLISIAAACYLLIEKPLMNFKWGKNN